ncbi:Potassium channel regulatory protein [Apodemus speciosus]|uniref:Potassium channel regulatory protein n=1 Tax=Apodemus speciosus TaxID=105296 RepID=A0ABQ0FI86_APOSI
MDTKYISIMPDNRKLANGTNVLGLLVDTLLNEDFRLVSTRTPAASGEKSECYVFERIKSQVLGMNKTPKSETTTMPAPSQK